MKVFINSTDPLLAIAEFLADSATSLSREDRVQLMTLSAAPAPVDRIVYTAEFLYSRAEKIGADGRELCASLVSYAVRCGWHQQTLGARADGMIQAMLREEFGEGLLESDPPPSSKFARPQT